MNPSKKILLVSVKFHLGHISHIRAWSESLSKLGHDVYILTNHRLHKILVDEGISFKIFHRNEKYSGIYLLFPSLMNLLVASYYRKSKIFFWFHEPINSIMEFRYSGFSLIACLKLVIIDVVNRITAKLSSTVLLPSTKSLEIYKKKYLSVNPSYYHLPLFFCDEYRYMNTVTNKSYFSYIGTIAPDHNFIGFLEIATLILKDPRCAKIKVLIATSSPLEGQYKTLTDSLLEYDRLEILEGNWLSNDQINSAYSKSFMVWNNYLRSNQSGVLPKALMFGCTIFSNGLFNSDNHIKESLVFVNPDEFPLDNLVHQIWMRYIKIEELSIKARRIYKERYDVSNIFDFQGWKVD